MRAGPVAAGLADWPWRARSAAAADAVVDGAHVVVGGAVVGCWPCTCCACRASIALGAYYVCRFQTLGVYTIHAQMSVTFCCYTCRYKKTSVRTALRGAPHRRPAAAQTQ